MDEHRELTDGYYAIKCHDSNLWELYKRENAQINRPVKSARTLQELRNFLEIRKLWRG